MKKNKKISLVILGIITLIFAIAAGYTFSKYFYSIPGSASATVAAWSFKANAGDETKKLTEIILKPTGGTKIAPGTTGEFQIKVDAIGSDVDVNYSVNISQEHLPANMRFKIKGETQEYNSMAALAEAKVHGTLDSTNQTKTYTVVWNWPYENTSTNTNSNDMNALNLSNVGFQIEVVGEQAE